MNACLKCKKCVCLIVLGKSNTRILHFLSSHLTWFDDFSSPEKQLHLYILTDKSTEWWHEVFTFCKLPVFRSLKNRNSRNCENIYGTEWNKCLQKPGVKTIRHKAEVSDLWRAAAFEYYASNSSQWLSAGNPFSTLKCKLSADIHHLLNHPVCENGVGDSQEVASIVEILICCWWVMTGKTFIRWCLFQINLTREGYGGNERCDGNYFFLNLQTTNMCTRMNVTPLW